METTYPHVGGGGITEIKAMATNVYRISISQEERIDQVTYEFDVKPDGKTFVLKRTEGQRGSGTWGRHLKKPPREIPDTFS